MKNQWDKFMAMLASLSFNQRITLGTLLVASAIAIFFFFNHANEDYDVMLSGLDEADAAAVAGNLKKQGIAYRLAEGGTTILVPKNKKEELRLGVFQEDLIKSDKTLGFGALSSLPFGMTDWQEKKYDQKIISDEVVKTLEHINGIRKARVILAEGSDSLFTENHVEPSASVMLIVEPGYRLKAEQVLTIKGLVAHSVPGLKPENVALSDSMGNALSEDIAANASGGGSEVDNIRSAYEKQKAKDILEMLVPLVGPNNAVVKVSAAMNFDRTESKIKRFIPTGGTAENPTGIPVSVQRNSEDYVGTPGEKPEEVADASNGANGGQPGINSNVPTYSAKDANSKGKSDKNYQNVSTVTNYEISSEEKTIVHTPGTVEHMSVAVVVNKVLTESETKELSNLVASASGADLARGDTITVSGLQFSPEVQEQHQKSLELAKQSDTNQLIVTLAQLLGVFALAGSALFVFYKLLHKPVQGELVEDGGEHEYVFAPEDTEPLLTTSTIPALEAKLDPELEHMRESINGMIIKDPTEAARILMTYMRDMQST